DTTGGSRASQERIRGDPRCGRARRCGASTMPGGLPRARWPRRTPGHVGSPSRHQRRRPSEAGPVVYDLVKFRRNSSVPWSSVVTVPAKLGLAMLEAANTMGTDPLAAMVDPVFCTLTVKVM